MQESFSAGLTTHNAGYIYFIDYGGFIINSIKCMKEGSVKKSMKGTSTF